ncbi:MAG: hypothetical protein ACRC53_04350 [Plesiomonas sp.]|uniref:hypothetical protein n=1 Tax=Plesiomonas sp. TaxID=2486279 RepID=UPI003F419B62
MSFVLIICTKHTVVVLDDYAKNLVIFAIYFLANFQSRSTLNNRYHINDAFFDRYIKKAHLYAAKASMTKCWKATKQQSNKATKQQSNKATKQQSNKATKQQSNK